MFNFPLFPLPMVAFPFARFSLQIFEPRYLDLVKSCLSNDSTFGIVTSLSDKYSQSGDLSIERLGVAVKIIDFSQQENGLLGIVCEGHDRFEVIKTSLAPSNLMFAQINELTESDTEIVPDKYQRLIAVLQMLLGHPYAESLGYISLRESCVIKPLSVNELSWHLAHLLPISQQQKYRLLETDNGLQRLVLLDDLVSNMQAGAQPP